MANITFAANFLGAKAEQKTLESLWPQCLNLLNHSQICITNGEIVP